MKDFEKEIENIFLDDEEDTLRRIKLTYDNSLKDVQRHAKELQAEIDKLLEEVADDDEIGQSKIRSKVYQRDYQKKLEKQINNNMDVLKDSDVKTISDYLNRTYSNGFLTEQYRLMNEGINVTMPINQKLMEKAVTFKTEDIPLSTRLYDNVEKSKKEIINEISRGLSTGMSTQDMARNIKNVMGVGERKAYQIAQNEGQRVRQSAIQDSMFEAKKKGADIVKQWLATLDGRTRPIHAELDGQVAEIDGYFKYRGGKVFAPKEFGIPSEDINCRCTLISVPRWDVEGKQWRMDNETKELVEVNNYQDWYNNVYNYKESVEVTTKTQSVIRNYESNVAQKMGKDTYDQYIDTLENCNNENLKAIYNKHLDEVTLLDGKYKSNAYFSGGEGGIKMDIASDSKDTSLRKKHGVFYHESGHELDYILGDENMFMYYSSQYKNGVFPKTIKEEVNSWVDNVYAKLKEDFKANKTNIEWLRANNYLSDYSERRLLDYAKDNNCTLEDIISGKVKVTSFMAKANLPTLSKSRAYTTIEKEIKQLTDYQKCDISDILQGATKNKIECGWGHKKSYFIDNPTNLEKEAFAEMTSAYISNQDSLEILKKYLPNSVKIYDEMIENIAKGIK